MGKFLSKIFTWNQLQSNCKNAIFILNYFDTSFAGNGIWLCFYLKFIIFEIEISAPFRLTNYLDSAWVVLIFDLDVQPIVHAKSQKS